jgi:hypothetical protein
MVPDFVRAEETGRRLSQDGVTLPEIINKEILEIKIDSPDKPGRESVDWTAVDFSKGGMLLQLHFD